MLGTSRRSEEDGGESGEQKEKGEERSITYLVHEDEGVDTEALEHAVRARDGVVGEGEEGHEDRIGDERDPVPERVVRRLRLGEAALWLRLA